jgi:hypothetical protein
MKPKVRNHLATLCLLYLKHHQPEVLKDLAQLAHENYDNGKPRYSTPYVLWQFEQKLTTKGE